MKKNFLMVGIGVMLIPYMGSCSSDSAEKGFEDLMSGVEIHNIPALDNLVLESSEITSLNASNSFGDQMFVAVLDNYGECFYDSADENVIYSPLSANINLAILANAASASTSDAIVGKLGFESLDQLNTTYNKLMRHLSSKDATGMTTRLANAIWHDEKTEANPSIAAVLGDKLYAEIVKTDLYDSKAVDLINSWCALKTENMIPKFLDEAPACELVWANALYTYGRWYAVFDKEKTDKQNFYGTKSTSKVDMMHSVSLSRNYTDNGRYQMLKYPFEGFETMFTIVLPAEGISCIDVLEEAMANMSTKPDSFTIYDVDLSFPKFEQAKFADLTDILLAEGVLPDANALKLLPNVSAFASIVRQKTALRVDEEGAEAAAVTLGQSYWATVPPEGIPVVMNVNRPFLFFIQDVKTGTVLLAGRINNL